MSTARQRHWDRVFIEKAPHEVSWYQVLPAMSLSLIEGAGINVESAHILDVGGGDSALVDALLDRGARDVSVLDISEAALARARRRLGDRAGQVEWIRSDVLEDWSTRPVNVWHDRAVFHFLGEADEQAAYLRRLRALLVAGGTLVIGTFGPGAPAKCSGLAVTSYRPEDLSALLGPTFRLDLDTTEDHSTPDGRHQRFTWCRFVHQPS